MGGAERAVLIGGSRLRLQVYRTLRRQTYGKAQSTPGGIYFWELTGPKGQLLSGFLELLAVLEAEGILLHSYGVL